MSRKAKVYYVDKSTVCYLVDEINHFIIVTPKFPRDTNMEYGIKGDKSRKERNIVLSTTDQKFCTQDNEYRPKGNYCTYNTVGCI